MNPSNSSNKSKWYERFAWIFMILFAVLWSLNIFFFVVLLGLGVIFAFLSIYHSGISISIFNDSPNASGSYSANQQNTFSGTQNPIAKTKIIRAAFLILGFGVLISIGLSIFSNDGSDPQLKEETVNMKGTETTQSQPTEEISLNEKGITFYNDGKYDSAIYYYDLAIKENPSDQDALLNKALAYFMMKEHRISINIINKFNLQNKNEGLWLLGDNYFEISEYDSALIALKKAYDNEYEDPNFLELLGDTYLKKDNRDRARQMYLKAIENDPSNNDIYERLIEVDPDNADNYRAKINSNKSGN